MTKAFSAAPRSGTGKYSAARWCRPVSLQLRCGMVALLAASGMGAQPVAKPISLEVRSTVRDMVLRVQVSAHEGAAFGLAVWNGAPGTVAQQGSRGVGTTPLIVSVSPPMGRIRLEVSANEPPIRVTLLDDTAKVPAVLALGRAIDVVRDSTGLRYSIVKP
jgi:hypothetical protein